MGHIESYHILTLVWMICCSLVTRGDRKPCVPADEPWVQDMVKHVHALRRHCKKHNYKVPKSLNILLNGVKLVYRTELNDKIWLLLKISTPQWI